MSDIDCDVCHPEAHVGCIPKPYNGAAPMGPRPGERPRQHRRCPEHAKIPPEQLEWDRAEVAHAAVAYEAGLEAGMRSGYQAGVTMRPLPTPGRSRRRIRLRIRRTSRGGQRDA